MSRKTVFKFKAKWGTIAIDIKGQEIVIIDEDLNKFDFNIYVYDVSIRTKGEYVFVNVYEILEGNNS